MKHIKLAVKLLLRELRQGELMVLFIALVIAIGSLSSIGFLTKRVEHSLQSHTAHITGAELILRSSKPVPEDWLQQAQNLQLETAAMVTFPSMVSVGDVFQLAQIKAVTDNFPLQGGLNIKKISASTELEETTQLSNAPPTGQIWIAPRLWQTFKPTLSSAKAAHLELGAASLAITAILDNMPGQSSGTLFSIAPTAVINMADLKKTATIQAGSRVEYLYFFNPKNSMHSAVKSDKSVQNYKLWLKRRLQPGQSVSEGAEGIRAINNNLNKAGQFLSLASLLSVLLAVIAIVISSHQYAIRQNRNHAVMMCLGATEKSVFKIALYKVLLLGLSGSVIGIVAGYIVHAALLSSLQTLIPKPLPAISLVQVAGGLLSGLLLILSVSVANLLRIRTLAPMAIFRNESSTEQTSRMLLYSFTFFILLMISWWSSKNIELTLWFYGSLFILTVMFYLLAKILLKFFFLVSQHYRLINRLSWINLHRHQHHVLLQITTFSLIFALIILLYLLRTELLQNWQEQLPQGTPNHFVINLQSYETQTFKHFLKENGVLPQGIFPMVRGRLFQLNGQPILDSVPEQARQHNALKRELNLSYALIKEDDQPLVQGQWWDKQDLQHSQLPLISIEHSLAQSLGINLGDRLGFQIGADKIEAIVKNIREVKWDSFKPNFYIVFSPGKIEHYPLTYITSFYLPEQHNLLNQLVKQFPGITLLEVDKILKEIQYIIKKITLSIEVVFGFILIAGLLVLGASLNSTLEIRRYENAVLRMLGASARQIRQALVIEFIVIAVFSGLIAILIAETAAAMLYSEVFKLSYSLHPQLWSVVILIAVLLITLSGLLMTNKILTQPATASLRKYG